MIFRDHDAVRRRLMARQQELEDLIESLRGKKAGATSLAPAAQENSELIDTIGNDATGELFLVRATLNRLDDGSFGQCVQCGAPISTDRITDYPYASLCSECAERIGGESGEHRFPT